MPPMTMLHDDLSELDLVWERVIKRVCLLLAPSKWKDKTLATYRQVATRRKIPRAAAPVIHLPTR